MTKHSYLAAMAALFGFASTAMLSPSAHAQTAGDLAVPGNMFQM